MAITPSSLRKQGISGVRVVRKQDTTVKKHGGNDESRGGEVAARGVSGAGAGGGVTLETSQEEQPRSGRGQKGGHPAKRHAEDRHSPGCS